MNVRKEKSLVIVLHDYNIILFYFHAKKKE